MVVYPMTVVKVMAADTQSMDAQLKNELFQKLVDLSKLNISLSSESSDSCISALIKDILDQRFEKPTPLLDQPSCLRNFPIQ